MRVDRVVRQEPLADARKLAAPPNLLGVQPAQQITERRHDNETKGRGLAGPVGASRRLLHLRCG
jgi:hypothetical protein